MGVMHFFSVWHAAIVIASVCLLLFIGLRVHVSLKRRRRTRSVREARLHYERMKRSLILRTADGGRRARSHAREMRAVCLRHGICLHEFGASEQRIAWLMRHFADDHGQIAAADARPPE